MLRTILRTALGVVLGLIVGLLIILAVEGVGHTIFPPPPSVPRNQASSTANFAGVGIIAMAVES